MDSPPAYRCPIGHRCPVGSPEPEPCPSDEYQTQSGQGTCNPCPAGSYCYDGTKITDCPAGSYCQQGNILINCPPGKYKDTAGGYDASSCKPCKAGLVCETPGTLSPSVTCAPGYYCGEGSLTRFPTSGTGGKCRPGYYCPERSSEEIRCTQGEYCATGGLSEPTGKCQEGYYCPEGSVSGKEHMCSQGHYCPEGSWEEYPCPIGTYGPLHGAAAVEDCIPCDMGAYCNVEGLPSPGAKVCAEGYYCPLNQMEGSPSSYICPKGHMCPQGSTAPEPCKPGTWQPNTGQKTCLDCDIGYYCDGVDGSQRIDCPRGYYCPAKTASPSKYACPAGKYGEDLRGEDSTDCKDCPAGYFCQEKGQSAYADLCA